MSQKVAIVVCALPPQGGGIGNNAYYHFEKLSQLDYQVKIFTPRYRNIEIINNQAVKYLSVVLPIGKAGFLFSLFKKLKYFDIVHLYYPFFGTDLIIMLFKILNPKKKLIIHYQMDPVGRGWQKIFFKLYIKLFLLPLVKLSDKIIVLSFDHARNTYLNQYLNHQPEKFVEIPNGIDPAIFKPQPQNLPLMNKYNITADDQVIIFAGGLDDQHFFKGVDVLIKSFSVVVVQNPNAKLLIIGDGNRKKLYEKLANDLNLQANVIFTGWVKNEKLVDYYNLGEVFVLPSTERTESFGIVIAEAQACGLPAVVSNWPGSRLTIADGQTGFLVAPKNEIDLATKIIKLLNDNNLRKAMSQKAITRARAKYAWESVIIKLDALYKSL